jgi:hypothetical protein
MVSAMTRLVLILMIVAASAERGDAGAASQLTTRELLPPFSFFEAERATLEGDGVSATVVDQYMSISFVAASITDCLRLARWQVVCRVRPFSFTPVFLVGYEQTT